jgi:hypothetical protein
MNRVLPTFSELKEYMLKVMDELYYGVFKDHENDKKL